MIYRPEKQKKSKIISATIDNPREPSRKKAHENKVYDIYSKNYVYESPLYANHFFPYIPRKCQHKDSYEELLVKSDIGYPKASLSKDGYDCSKWKKDDEELNREIKCSNSFYV